MTVLRSLRSRLVVGLVAIAAVGLVLLGGITYVQQRSFLLDRIDAQARDAQGFATSALIAANNGSGQSYGFGAGGPPDGGGRGRRPPNVLPPGAYVELRNAAGAKIGVGYQFGYTYGGSAPAKPRLPARLAGSGTHEVDSSGGDDDGYRVVSLPADERVTAAYPGATTVVAVPLTDVSQTLNRLLLVLALVAAGILVVIALGASLLVRIGLRPLDRMGRAAEAIAAGDLDRRVAPAGDGTEVGRLGLALNAMLGRLERAFSEQRRSEERLRVFLADASHELRTPLSSIRGYAELHRMGATADPEVTTRAMERIEGEARRMGVLVEDLLALARMDEPREPVRDAVDLAELVRDGVDDARASAPERAITGTVPDEDDAATVIGDGDQLRQVLTNLVRNALVHTPADAAVDLSAERVGDRVRLVVRDHGQGLPTDEPEQLFERFWRAEGGRKQGPAGAGLGLAVVAGIVDAHDGTVVAEQAEGGGARFVVDLPAAGAGAAD